MVKYNKNQHPIIISLIIAFVIGTVMAQRPSFAGSRPNNGLNQKDKYLSTTPATGDIQNRFGGADAPAVVISNQIPFGQPQNPPVGYPVVVPESSYVPLARPSSIQPTVINSNNVSTGVQFEDRFGGTDDNTITSTVRPGPLPLDAHGDQLLIDQLNRIPVDKRPFWYINYQAIEAQRNGTGSNFAGAQSSRGSFFG